MTLKTISGSSTTIDDNVNEWLESMKIKPEDICRIEVKENHGFFYIFIFYEK